MTVLLQANTPSTKIWPPPTYIYCSQPTGAKIMLILTYYRTFLHIQPFSVPLLHLPPWSA